MHSPATIGPRQIGPLTVRRQFPRFEPHSYAKIRATIMPDYIRIASEVGCTPAQLALAWLLHKAPHIVAIPGTRRLDHALENLSAMNLRLSVEVMNQLNQLINPKRVAHPRYSPAAQADVDTEQIEYEPSP